MPNGGSDCCGTCWYNAKVRARMGLDPPRDGVEAYCQIRQLAIARPYWTYCANHPHRCPEGDPIPLGPVFVGRDLAREIWQPSPDMEEIRAHLLDLAAAIVEQPRQEYPMGAGKELVVVWQLGEFREKRAVPELSRIAKFDPAATTGEPFRQTRAELVAGAKAALRKINEAKGAVE